MHEDPKMIEIARDSMILVVAQGHPLQPLTHRRYRLPHPATPLCLYRMQACHHPLLFCFPPDDQGPPPQPLPHRRYRLVHPATQLCLYRTQLSHHPLLCRFPPDDEGPTAPALPTVMREAQEREGLGFSLPTLLPVSSGEPPELNQPRLLRM